MKKIHYLRRYDSKKRKKMEERRSLSNFIYPRWLTWMFRSTPGARWKEVCPATAGIPVSHTKPNAGQTTLTSIGTPVGKKDPGPLNSTVPLVAKKDGIEGFPKFVPVLIFHPVMSWLMWKGFVA